TFRKTLLSLRIERREGERRRAFEIPRHEEASGWQRRTRVAVAARVAQIGLEQIREFLRHRFVGGRRWMDLGERGMPVLRRHLAAFGAAFSPGPLRPFP